MGVFAVDNTKQAYRVPFYSYIFEPHPKKVRHYKAW